MTESSFHYWVVPIICIIVGMLIFSYIVDYKVNTIFPNAELERQEMKELSCPEILIKDHTNDYWTSENREIGKNKAIGCSVPQESQSTGLSPYVEFCTPGGFAPIKKIGNNTHSFNHDTCIWDLK